jgi:uncharacterized protein YkwD
MNRKIVTLVVSVFLFFTNASAQKNKKTTSKGKSKPVAAKTVSDKTETSTFSKTDNEVFTEINSLRANPQSFIPYLEEMKKSYKGRIYTNKDGIEFSTNEGTMAVDEAIEFLKKQTSLAPLKLSKGLSKAAAAHLEDMAKTGIFSSQGSNMSSPNDRANLFGVAKFGVIQNMTEGIKNPREIILQMLVSDGQKSRTQRNNLLKPEVTLIGVSTGEGKKGTLCVLVLTNSYLEK